MRFSVNIASTAMRAMFASFALAALSCIALSSAAERDYYFVPATGTGGLAQNTVTAMVQDSDGFAWIGTQSGLHRFEGQHYTLYQNNPDSPDSLPDNFVTALARDADRDELRLMYQPRLALAPEPRIIGVEALLRWHSAEYGQIPPSEFIPLAEESGQILEIGEWVLREACLTLGRWRQHDLVDLGVSVNVSALQLLRGDLAGVVERVLEESSLPAPALELELTESVIMANARQTAEKLRAFRELGVTLAIDDFGTGYSSLAYLKRLPINTLKIDKEFIDNLSHGSDDAAITTTIIAMAHSLGLNVVAEGVETAEQLQFLRRHRCDEIQGYWLSPPLEAQRCLAFIRNWTPAAMHDAAATVPPQVF